VCHCPVLACKGYETVCCMFFKPKNLENMRVNSLISLVAKTRLAIALQPQSKSEETQRNYYDLCVSRVHNGTTHFSLLLLLHNKYNLYQLQSYIN